MPVAQVRSRCRRRLARVTRGRAASRRESTVVQRAASRGPALGVPHPDAAESARTQQPNTRHAVLDAPSCASVPIAHHERRMLARRSRRNGSRERGATGTNRKSWHGVGGDPSPNVCCARYVTDCSTSGVRTVSSLVSRQPKLRDRGRRATFVVRTQQRTPLRAARLALGIQLRSVFAHVIPVVTLRQAAAVLSRVWLPLVKSAVADLRSARRPRLSSDNQSCVSTAIGQLWLSTHERGHTPHLHVGSRRGRR